jgi:hypothetical protein
MAKPTANISCSFHEMLGGKDTDTTVSPEFKLEPVEVLMMEMEDVLFHLDSAVMMPERPKGKSSSDGTEDDATDPDDVKIQEDQDKVSGLQAIALALKQFEFDSQKRLLIAGHADTSGGAKMNFELSALRAENVRCLLEGYSYGWVDVSEKRHRIEDYQQILMYMKDSRSWTDCDPVKIDDKWSDDVDKATRAFIKRYNEWAESPEGPGPDISNPISEATADKIKKDPKHKWPAEMWFAVFNIYDSDIAAALQVDRWHLNHDYRSGLIFCNDNKKYLACGESYPIDDAEKDNYRSQVNRRVELFFFDKANVPKIDCPARVDTIHKAPECPMWHKYHFKRTYVDGDDLTSVAYYLRFVYYDPLYKKLVSVPDGLQFKVTENDGKPLTAKSKYKNGVYQLKVKFGNRIVDPNRKSLHVRFSAAKKWVYRASADDPGKIVSEAEMTAALQALRDKKQSDAEEKWKYYDLPAEWLSDDWCVRSKNQEGGGVTDDDIKDNKDKKHVFKALFSSESSAPAKFKPFGNELSQPDKPLVFSLDDLVLTADNLATVAVANPQQVALLDDKFAVINPDATNHQSYYTENVVGSVAANGEITGLMISGYVPFFGKPLHGVVAQNRLYAVFKDRVTASAPRIGHRAAVYKHKTKCLLVEQFQQRHYRTREHTDLWDWTFGNFDCYLLREQGFEAGEEISHVFSYFRWRFQDKVTTTPVVNPTWADTAIKNIMAAWNDEEVGGRKLVSLLATNDVTKRRVFIRFYMQSVAAGQQHTIVSVHPAGAAGRSFMGRSNGEIRGDQTQRANAWSPLTAAHEFGHAGSLDDDYLERANNCCYGMVGLPDFKPGAPYNADAGSMMKSNQDIRARQYWHYAEWLRSRLVAGKKLDFVVCKTNNPNYKLPFHPSLAWDPANYGTHAHHYYNYPEKQGSNRTNSVSSRGRFNLYLYPLGEDRYSQAMPRIMKKCTALLIVKVNLRFQFWDPWIGASATIAEIVDALGKIDLGITKQFGDANVLKICGDAPYTETMVQFQPRYLVNNYTSQYAATYYKELNTSAKYGAQRDWILAQPEAQPHYVINVSKSGTSEWDHYDHTPGELDLAVGDATDFWKFFAEMVGLTNGQVPSATNFAVGTLVPNGKVQLA